MKPILIIDPGHGGKDPGGGSNKLWLEKDLNLKISLYQYEHYREIGVPVMLTRENDQTLTSSQRTKIVRESGAKYCHSNHINAGGGDGAEVIHSIYGGKEMAALIAKNLKDAGQNVRRVFTRTLPGTAKQDYYYMNRETGRVTTNIIEYGFADSPRDDVAQLKENYKNYAEAVVKAFCEFAGYGYQGVKIKETVPPERGESKYLHLPSDAKSWRVYPLSAVPVKGNEKGFLKPSKFGGLTYEIIDNPQDHVYLIQTRDFGRVQIYAHPQTGAVFSNK